MRVPWYLGRRRFYLLRSWGKTLHKGDTTCPTSLPTPAVATPTTTTTIIITTAIIPIALTISIRVTLVTVGGAAAVSAQSVWDLFEARGVTSWSSVADALSKTALAAGCE